MEGEWYREKGWERYEVFFGDCVMIIRVLWVDFRLYRDRNDIDLFCEFWCMLFKEERKKIFYISLLMVRGRFLRNIIYGGYWGIRVK